MALHNKMFNSGKLSGVVYDFEYVDDILPMHEHEPGMNHMTIIARGSFLARGKDWAKNVNAGDVMDWQPYDSHEFVALEPNSRLINIQNGI